MITEPHMSFHIIFSQHSAPAPSGYNKNVRVVNNIFNRIRNVNMLYVILRWRQTIIINRPLCSSRACSGVATLSSGGSR